jgi:hypothetical protein
MSKNPEFHDRTKHIDIQYHFLRAHVSTRRVEIQYCRTEEMVADILTKALPRAKHDWCVKAMGLITPEDGSTRAQGEVAEEPGPSSKGEIVGVLGSKRVTWAPDVKGGPRVNPKGVFTHTRASA